MASTIIKGKNPGKPWTVRYWHDAKQRERSFRTSREANDFKAKFENDSREQIYIDPKLGSVTFREYSDAWLAAHAGTVATNRAYKSMLTKHLYPAIGDSQLRKITREDLTALLAALPLGDHAKSKARLVLTGILGEAVRAKRITDNPAAGIKLPVASRAAKIDLDKITPDKIDKLTAALPEPMRFTVPLMAGCGLRISEALAVRSGDFNGRLRITGQINPATRSRAPLKHRGADGYRDIPVPAWVRQAMPKRQGDLFSGITHDAYRLAFTKARQAAGLPIDFTPHTLRHVFASVALSQGVPITDVAAWLGHTDINVTFSIYGHLVPSAWDRAVAALDAWHAEA
ncbi:MAG TPA: tyrosine-type recombinase/integrase [Streptosporangiaceae bacterium]|jgi:integrase|nr:tyrosine-type recombinase/integrase [Streptosporangiaceae bacterium]